MGTVWEKTAMSGHLDELRRKSRALQERLDEEGDIRAREARTVLEINTRASGGGGAGLMDRMGYSAGVKSQAEMISRTRQMRNARDMALETAESLDPLSVAGSRT